MEKEFTIKIFKQKAGQSEKFSHEIFSGSDKKEAFIEARNELIRIANCDLDQCYSEGTQSDIQREIDCIEKGKSDYYCDQTTFSFKVFSKKSK